MRRFVSIPAVALVVGLLLDTAVSADFVEGTGTLGARGAGIARVAGDRRVDITGHGIGAVSVRNAEELSTSGRGIRMDLPGDVVFFGGWPGKVHASGEELTVTMAGGMIEFAARGTATVLLLGRGRYWINSEPGEWTLTGIAIDIEAHE